MDARTAQRLAKIAPLQTLVLTHYGRKSGKPYDVTIWFVVEDERMFLATANKNRQWVRNVLAKPKVELKAAGETFTGIVSEIIDSTVRAHVVRAVQSKYWYATPILVIGRGLQRLGLVKDNTAAFEAKIESAAA